MTYELTQTEVESILNVIAREGVRAYESGVVGATTKFSDEFQSIIEKLDPKGWAEAQATVGAQKNASH